MRAFAVGLLLIGLLLGGLGWLVLGLHIGEPLVPAPETIVQEFVSRLSEGRYESAQMELDEDQRQDMSIEELEQLDRALKQKLGGYEFQLGGSETKQGEQATYLAKVSTEKQGEKDFQFELKRDDQTGLWEISALDDLEQAAQR